MLGKFIAGDFIAIAGEMRQFPASNENTGSGDLKSGGVLTCIRNSLHISKSMKKMGENAPINRFDRASIIFLIALEIILKSFNLNVYLFN